MNDGGPAFPQAMDAGTGTQPASGMSLRDWFAGQALIACMSSVECVDALNKSCAKNNMDFATGLAAMSLRFSDAMLAARSKDAPPATDGPT